MTAKIKEMHENNISSLITYKLKNSVIFITEEYDDGEFISTCSLCKNIWGDGDTIEDSIEDLKYEIEDMYEFLIDSPDETLHENLLEQKNNLKKIVDIENVD